MQEIIPQLFARLSSHPEKIVRELLESILLKLGKLSPCSIVYPTLVDINACEGEPSEELQHISDFLVFYLRTLPYQTFVIYFSNDFIFMSLHLSVFHRLSCIPI
jgi:hypothetical protein